VVRGFRVHPPTARRMLADLKFTSPRFPSAKINVYVGGGGLAVSRPEIEGTRVPQPGSKTGRSHLPGNVCRPAIIDAKKRTINPLWRSTMTIEIGLFFALSPRKVPCISCGSGGWPRRSGAPGNGPGDRFRPRAATLICTVDAIQLPRQNYTNNEAKWNSANFFEWSKIRANTKKVYQRTFTHGTISSQKPNVT